MQASKWVSVRNVTNIRDNSEHTPQNAYYSHKSKNPLFHNGQWIASQGGFNIKLDSLG